MLKKFLPAFLFSFILMSGVAHAQTAELLSYDFWYDSEYPRDLTVAIMEKAIKDGADVNAVNEDGMTPLMYAGESHGIDILEVLIKHGADVNAVAKSGYTPLMAASKVSSAKTIDFLVKHGADVNAKDKAGRTALMYTCAFPEAQDVPDPEQVNALVKHGADVNARDNDGMTPLMLACKYTAEPRIIEFLLKHNPDIKAKDKAGKTALDYIKESDYAPHFESYDELVKMLTPAHAQTSELLSNDFWKTATVADVKKAIEDGADVNARNESGHTPLMVAIVISPDIEILEALIKNGADPNLDVDGVTPLLIASINEPDPEIIEALIKNGADVNKRYENGLTILALLSVEASDPEIIKVFIKNGADVNEKFENDVTALMLASSTNPEPKITEVLLRSDGINIHAKGTAGKTAFDHAKENKGLYNTDVYKKMEKMMLNPSLILKGDQVFVQTKGESTALPNDMYMFRLGLVDQSSASKPDTLRYVATTGDAEQEHGIKMGLYFFKNEGEPEIFLPFEDASFVSKVQLSSGMPAILGVDSGTSPIRQCSFFSYPKMAPLGSVEYFEKFPLWVGNKGVLFTGRIFTGTAYDGPESPGRTCAYDCDPSATYYYTFEDKKTQTLMAGTDLCNFVVTGYDQDSNLAIIEKECRESAKDWDQQAGTKETLSVLVP